MKIEDEEQPTSGHKKTPMWIKIMWICGICWVLGYIILGLSSDPTHW
jgi:hypothetical protein